MKNFCLILLTILLCNCSAHNQGSISINSDGNITIRESFIMPDAITYPEEVNVADSYPVIAVEETNLKD